MLERSGKLQGMDGTLSAAAGGRPQLILGAVLTMVGSLILYLGVLALVAHAYGI